MAHPGATVGAGGQEVSGEIWSKRAHAAALADRADHAVCKAKAEASTTGEALIPYLVDNASVFDACLQARRAEEAAAAAAEAAAAGDPPVSDP